MDFGTKNKKHARDLWLTHRTDGRISVTISTDEDATTEVERRTQIVSDELHEEKLKVPRGLKGRYYTFEVKNLSGADFDLDSISVMVDVLGGKRR